MVTLIPAILATTEEQFSQELEHLKKSSSFAEGWVHIDFMDGELVETKSIEVEVLEKFDIPFKKEAHLMVKRPYDWIESLKKGGFERVIIHDEALEAEKTLIKIKELGMESGLSLNPETQLEEAERLIGKIDVLQIMAIHPGKQGQPFLDSTYDRVKEAVKVFDMIEVDGGVNEETAAKLVEAGAKRLVMGSFLQKGEVDQNVEKIWEVIG